ncbi:hypothetical protein F0562_013738 [Nyssa sinensis]|uniref:Uncharacterized protein n=1 Tax=Nyssa sinensis TaxID=561372 RepID=A0A5J4ZPR8_9ASTE|nr:hypothetical protein F0562_013738 [Nyssa sinensis]
MTLASLLKFTMGLSSNNVELSDSDYGGLSDDDELHDIGIDKGAKWVGGTKSSKGKKVQFDPSNFDLDDNDSSGLLSDYALMNSTN